MTKKYIILIVLACIGAYVFFSCSDMPKKTQEPQIFTGIAMTLPYRILVGEPADEKSREVLSTIIVRTFAEVDEIYNKWNPLSEITKLNNAKAGQKIDISFALAHFLRKVEEIVVMTDGRFDPTVETYQKIWKKYLDMGKTPPEEEVAGLAKAAGWHNIHIQNSQFYKDHDATQLDVGGITKGYAVDLLVKRIKDAGYSNVFVEWGGNVHATGLHPSGRRWSIYVSKLENINPQNAIAHISLSNQSIATSGDHIQHWKVGDVTYSHIFDSLTLQPMPITPNSVVSASVVAPSCFLADALATTALTFATSDEAKAWADAISKEMPDVAIWLISRTTTDMDRLD
jgi:thiamine biosynthesis lipoprotein